MKSNCVICSTVFSLLGPSTGQTPYCITLLFGKIHRIQHISTERWRSAADWMLFFSSSALEQLKFLQPSQDNIVPITLSCFNSRSMYWKVKTPLCISSNLHYTLNYLRVMFKGEAVMDLEAEGIIPLFLCY